MLGLFSGIRRDMRWQILLPPLGLLLVIGIFGIFLFGSYVEQDLRNEMLRRAEFAGHSIQYAAETASTPQQIRRYVAVVGAEEEFEFAVVVAGQPVRVIACTELGLIGQKLAALPLPHERALLQHVMQSRAQSYAFDRDGLFSFAQPTLIVNVTNGDVPLGEGALLLKMRTDAVAATVRDRQWIFGVLFGATLIGLGAALLIAVRYSVRRPQQQLLETVTARQRGEKVLTAIPGGNEFARLGEAFNEMLRLNDEHAESLRMLNEKLTAQAILDGLTGIANRRHFNETLTTEIRRAARYRRWLSLILLDIDMFKRYNDNYGHLAGDAVLVKMARTLEQVFERTGDLPARYGGEEFAVILPDTAAESARKLAEELRLAVAAQNIAHAHSPVSDRLTISVGLISIIPVAGTVPNTLVRAADDALYAAKADGRDRIVVGHV